MSFLGAETTVPTTDGHGTPRDAARPFYEDGPTTGKLGHVARPIRGCVMSVHNIQF